MSSITIHGLDEDLNKCIRDKAKEKGLSINKTLKKILSESLGLLDSSSQDHRNEFIDLWGQWTSDDIAEFNKKLSACESVDQSDWQ